ncbi:MAG: 3-phosphoshikimate 1-carboxyvinyltransferase, partial [Desulfovibrionaceae bacterium]|nr:3-phosphoshikimate 1-carboxyvinyltransferase [Desulfovibrionaceae bacterium]
LGELCQALTDLGAGILFEGQAHCPPLLLQAHGLNPKLTNGVTVIGMDHSSQYFSGLLLAAPFCTAPLTVVLGGSKVVSWPYVGLTLQCMEDFGISFDVEERPDPASDWRSLPAGQWRQLREARPGCVRVRVMPGSYQAGEHSVEGDWSGASYLLAAGALGSRPVRVEGLRSDSLQGDRAILDILQQMGARIELEPAAVTVYPSQLHGVSLDMGPCPDLVPTVAVLASFATGSTRISNVAHLRIKESDRINAPAAELGKLGITLDQLSDGLLISGTGGLAGHERAKVRAPRLPDGLGLSAHNDHRMAMSLALLELRDPSLHVRERLDDPTVVRKSFPRFWDVWSRLL